MASPALRPYAPGDETGIRLLFSQVHKRELSPETWCWRYRLNPAGESVVTVAVEDGEVVGHVGVLPMLVSGHAAGLWVDLMIRQDRRNLDLFLDMAQASLEATERAGMEFVYAFPNDKSHPVLKRMLGWRTLREIDALEAPLRMLEAPTPALKAEPFSAAGPEFDAAVWNGLASRIFYFPGSVDRVEDFHALRGFLQEAEGGGPHARIYYLSMAPQFYESAVANLGAARMADEAGGPRRIVVEKPFGADLASARQLNGKLHEVFTERQIYRIDHYLGKETVQNVLVLRFANTIFEPIWNRNYISHVEITAAESLTVGHRAGYYDAAEIGRAHV